MVKTGAFFAPSGELKIVKTNIRMLKNKRMTSPLRSWVRFSLQTHDTRVKKVVNTLPKFVGFLRVLLRGMLTGRVGIIHYMTLSP